ncbi:ABC-three component system protein [Nocardia gamkensis]|uniref:ABC-three component system protein n=1 Tax=Nocardia gamkensis TaxID=352869 RepID=UPI0037C608ED
MAEDALDGGVDLVPIPKPTLLDAGSWMPTPSHLSITPEQHLSLYSDKQWEEFVLEWATVLPYAQVMRSGGAHDHGVDVAGFVTDAGFDGEWDCLQCKHYGRALLPGDAYPEILKVVIGTLSGHYTWPRAYRFAAPKGCGTTLASVIHSPSSLRAQLRAALTKTKSPLLRILGRHSLDSVLDFIDHAEFSGFGTVELHELVSLHQQTRWHSARFGVELPNRPHPPTPSEEPTEDEQRYVAKLLAAYAERHGDEFTPSLAAHHPQASNHYLRQRVAFYSAEALRMFARDSVPVGTFDKLQEQIFEGVVDVHDANHADGLERLLEVMRAAHGLAITANGLLPVVEIRDRTGICHQLANDDKLSWCHATPE